MGAGSTTGHSENRVKDMTVGSPLKLIFLFALPILAGTLFQQFYNIVDTKVAGEFLGDNALAAIGATSAVYSVIFGMANGMNNGYAIIVSRAFGEKDFEKVRDSVGLMLLLNVFVSVAFTVLAAAFVRPLLVLIKTPEEIMGEAYLYIIFVLLALIITIAYNMEAAVLRALGNSRTPLIYLIIASILNVVLDLVFVAGLGMGVEGLAAATVIAQLISVIFCYIHIKKHYPMLKLHKKNFVLKKDALTEMFTTGLSMGLMYSIFYMGTVILQSGINSLGTQTITAHLAARKVDEMIMLPISTLTTANSTFISQNFGAGKIKRVQEGIRKTCMLGFIWSGFVTILTFLASSWAVKALTSTSSQFVIDTATRYLWINVPFFFVLTVLVVLRTSLQGMGSKIAPLISSSFELIAKLAATWFMIPALGYFGVCLIEPLTWILCMLWLAGSYMQLRKQLRKGEKMDKV